MKKYIHYILKLKLLETNEQISIYQQNLQTNFVY